MVPNKPKINFLIAQSRVKDLRKFYISLFAFVAVNLLIAVRHYYKFGVMEMSFAHSLIMAIWLIVLMIKASKLLIFDQNWENQKINEIINQKN